MIEGTPARLLMLVWMKSLNRFGLANSSRYTAAPTPTGTANRTVMATSQRDPRMAVRIPAVSGVPLAGDRMNVGLSQALHWNCTSLNS